MVEKKETIAKEGIIFAIVERGEIILEKRLNPNKAYYNFTVVPGGKIETDETIEQAFVREMDEESGLKPKQWKYIRSINLVTEKGPYTQHIFLVTKTDGEFNGQRLQESILIKVSLKEAMGLCRHPVSKQVLQIIGRELTKD
jgi:mutator protein MutT